MPKPKDCICEEITLPESILKDLGECEAYALAYDDNCPIHSDDKKSMLAHLSAAIKRRMAERE